ncbi:MAG: nucleoside triphosphate pyrophosphohydrolase, partial [Prolixibacteraceae bacterium]|nr:nucleoside triphosphate pyrophosphohydrolase [Prolixibacteraceae bacterium]
KGLGYETRILDDTEYFGELLRKLIEESQEACDTTDDEALLEELADVQQVIFAILAARGLNRLNLHVKRESKLETHGDFDDKIYLVSVTEHDQ